MKHINAIKTHLFSGHSPLDFINEPTHGPPLSSITVGAHSVIVSILPTNMKLSVCDYLGDYSLFNSN